MKKIILITYLMILIGSDSIAQKLGNQRIPLIGTVAPSFKAPSTKGPVNFPTEFGKKWKILFAHPRDFTPVCSSEILELAYRQDEFSQLNTQIVVVSVDKLVSHQNWKDDLEQIDYKGHGKVKINFPLVVDSSFAICDSYGMLDTKSSRGKSVRGIFFINPENEISAFYFYPNEVGRNTDEIIRTLKALQTSYIKNEVVLPCNWQPGDDVMIPFLTKEDKEELKKPEPSIHYINWYMIYKKLK
jgi:peroxiredoxin (alkyl hydroperoxide reductase subunit C)